MMKNICVFLGSRSGIDAEHTIATKKLGALMAKNSLRLIYGGGRVGLMGILADSVLENKGEVIGVIPKSLFSKEVVHTGLTELHEVSSMHERKALMESLSEGFIALPGGFGTLDELCEIITWAQIGIHKKPVALLNNKGFFDHFMKFVNHSCTEGFIAPNDVSQLTFSEDPEVVIQSLIEKCSASH